MSYRVELNDGFYMNLSDENGLNFLKLKKNFECKTDIGAFNLALTVGCLVCAHVKAGFKGEVSIDENGFHINNIMRILPDESKKVLQLVPKEKED